MTLTDFSLLHRRHFMFLWVLWGALSAMSASGDEFPAHAVFEPESPQAVKLGENLFLHAAVKASSQCGNYGPKYAVDGSRDNPGQHWAAENLPVWLTVELKEPATVNAIRLWTYWDHKRWYQYAVEGSLDGQNWTILADRRDNMLPATETGHTLLFPPTKVKFVRTTIARGSAGGRTGGHIVEIEGYSLSPQDSQSLVAQEKIWGEVPVALQGAFGSIDIRYARHVPPQTTGERRTSLAAWRGERVHAQLVLWTRPGAQQVRLVPGELTSQSGATISANYIRGRFVRYVLGDKKLMPDVLDTVSRLDLPATSTRPVWLSIDVPRDAKPGKYQGLFHVQARDRVSLPFTLDLEVLPVTLPPPSQWKFRLDLWQNPFAVARYHHVEPWSEEHFRLLEPHLRMLADAGAKCITTSVIDRPWGTQTFDPYDAMIDWRRRADGSWHYDYAVFDRYVQLCMRCGIADSINCYTVSSPRYFDEATGDYRRGLAWEDAWRPFLNDFVAHLKQRGWLEKTAVAMDEWPLEQMKSAIGYLRRTAPELKIALAGHNLPALKDDVDDWCIVITPPLDKTIIQERAAKGRPTTFYVCCGPGRPNTFTFSPPAESAWMGWYAAAQGYSGFLRWAYDSWTADPLLNTSYYNWPAGDCFLVYPGARSSVRFERLREGIQDYEKLRIVRKALASSSKQEAKDTLAALETALTEFTYAKASKEPAAGPVNKARAALEAASRSIPGPGL